MILRGRCRYQLYFTGDETGFTGRWQSWHDKYKVRARTVRRGWESTPERGPARCRDGQFPELSASLVLTVTQSLSSERRVQSVAQGTQIFFCWGGDTDFGRRHRFLQKLKYILYVFTKKI